MSTYKCQRCSKTGQHNDGLSSYHDERGLCYKCYKQITVDDPIPKQNLMKILFDIINRKVAFVKQAAKKEGVGRKVVSKKEKKYVVLPQPNGGIYFQLKT